MLGDLSDLRESVYAVRLLREHVLATPLRPDVAARVRARVLAENGRPPASARALVVAVGAARDAGVAAVTADLVEGLAEAASPRTGARLRTGPGAAFHGRSAPPAARVGALLGEMTETLGSPVAVETWPPAVRAFAAHFLVRLVQPYEAPAAALGHALEAALLAADGLAADRVLLPEPDVGADLAPARPDPDAFVRARLDRLVERLAETQEIVRTETARAALLSWCDERGAGLNARQRRLVRWLAEGDGEPRTIGFREYVRLHAGRRAPSLRSLQRDWKSLRERGVLGERDGRLAVDPDVLAYGVSRG